MKRLWKTLGLGALLSAALSFTAFAGQWQSDSAGWWWQEDDGSYAKGSWQWLDGNQDGQWECYYFYDNGYLAVNTTVDGYRVDGNGCWVENAQVQTRTAAQDARQRLQAALEREKAQNTANLDADMLINMQIAMEGLTMDINMTGNMKMKNGDSADMQYLMDLNMNLLGQDMSLQSFYTDGYMYMDMYGMKMKTPMDYTAAMESAQSSGMTTGLADVYDMAYIQNVSAVDNANGTTTIYYTIDGTKMNELLQIILSNSAVNDTLADMSLGTCKSELTMDAAGNVIQERVLMDMGTTIDGTAVNYHIFMEMNIKNPGQPVNFSLPSTEGYEEMAV